MKRFLSILLTVAIVVGVFTSAPVIVSAAGESYLTFSLNEDGNSYSVTKCRTTARNTIDIPATYNDLPVVAIADSAFSSCIRITAVTIPNSVKSIGDSAFSGCKKLSSIKYIGTNSQWNKVYVGLDNSILDDIKIEPPENQEYVDGYLTYILNDDGISYSVSRCDLSATGEIDVPSTINSLPVTTIGDRAFADCSEVTAINLPNSIIKFGDGVFSDCWGLTSLTIPDSVTTMGDSTFNSCTRLETITIPDSVTTLGINTFEYCRNLESVVFGDGLTTIKDYMFYGCSSLKSAVIGDGVTALTAGLFSYVSTLEEITIGKGVKSIENGAIPGGLSIVNITDMKSWCEIDFESYSANPIGKATKLYLNGNLVTELIIPDSVTNIGNYAFSGCSSITSVKIPESVKSIGVDAFDNCLALEKVEISSLSDWCTINFAGSGSNPLSYAQQLYLNGNLVTDLVIPDSITTIGNYAFSGCSSITSVKIPESVKSIGVDAFDNCLALEKVEISSLSDWCTINFAVYGSNPLSYAQQLYLNGELVTDLVIPEGIEKVNEYTFYNCKSITTVEIAESVTEIGGYAFYDCNNLTKATINGNLDNIIINSGNECLTDVLEYTPINYLSFALNEDGNSYKVSDCSDTLEGEIIIPDEFKGLPVTAIGDNAFSGCSGLTSIDIPGAVTSIGSSAFSGCSGLTAIDIPDNITSIGEYAFFGCYELTMVNISDLEKWCTIDFSNSGSNPLCYAGNLYLNNVLVTDLEIPETVEEIKPYAFYGCTSITSVTMQKNIIKIGEYAFADCSNLTEVEMSEDVTEIALYAFGGCSSLTEIKIPDSVTSMGDGVFGGCEKLSSVTLSKNLTNIPWSCFYNCKGLLSITIPDSVETFDTYAFCESGIKTITFGTGLKTISKYAFEGCENLTELELPNSVETLGERIFSASALEKIKFGSGMVEIGEYVFEGANNLHTITIPGSIKKINNRAFWRCENLSKVILEEGFEAIGDDVFYYCEKLEEVVLPETLLSIGESAFAYTAMTSINIPKNTTVIEPGAFIFSNISNITVDENNETYSSYEGVLFSKDKSVLVTYPFAKKGSYNAPEGIEEIGMFAFYGNSYIEKITIPKTVNKLNPYSIYYCTNLTEVEILGEVTEIPIACFTSCTSLEKINIPKSVTSIDEYAFAYCYALKEIIIPNSVTAIVDDAFDNTDCTIVCKSNSYAKSFAEENGMDIIISDVTAVDENTVVDEENLLVFTTLKGKSSLAEMIKTATEILLTGFSGENKFFGTGTEISQTISEQEIDKYTLVVTGDTNGDGVCDVLDAAQVALFANGMKTPETYQAYAANGCAEEMVDAEDYQSVVNMALAG